MPVTEVTGLLPRAAVRYTLHKVEFTRVVVRSRNVLKRPEVKNEFDADSRPRLFLSDGHICNAVLRALQGIDGVLQAAGLMEVEKAEYNPSKFVNWVSFLSPNKASLPINLHRAPKLRAEKLFIAANRHPNQQEMRLAVVPLCRVMRSHGSAVTFLQQGREAGEPLPMRDERMTRFWIDVPHAVSRFAEWFVCLIASIKLLDLIAVFAPGAPTVISGIQPGEKLHEKTISPDDLRALLETE